MSFGDLPKPAQLGILIGSPVVLAGVFGYLAFTQLKLLGNDPALDAVSFLQQDSADALYAQIQTTETQAIQREGVAARFDATKAELDRQQARKIWLEQELPGDEKKEEMRQDLEEWMRETTDAELGTVRLVSVRIIESGGNADPRRRGRGQQSLYREVKYQIEILADMNGLFAYLDRVEDAQRHLAVRSIQLTPGEITVDPETLSLVPELHEVSLEVITYVYQDEAAGGAR